MAVERETTSMGVIANNESPGVSSLPVAANADAARLGAATKRPGRSRSMTVGSARTAALD